MITLTGADGAIAQLVERMNRTHEVTGSTPVGSTIYCCLFGNGVVVFFA